MGHFGDQNDVIGPHFRVGRKYFFLKTVSKVILVSFINITLAKNVINGVNLVKIGHFWAKWSKFGDFGGQNEVIGQNLGKVVKSFFP